MITQASNEDAPRPETPFWRMLPIRPAPSRQESLTSYLRRLAEANSMTSVDALTAVTFAGQDRRVSRLQLDLPPTSIHQLALVSGQTSSNLLSLTFYHLGKKFCRSPHPQSLSRFMSGVLNNNLHYCPPCIAEQRHFNLTWRIKHITGCLIHNCYLLSVCTKCQQPLPIFGMSFSISKCPTCHCDISENPCLRETEVAVHPETALGVIERNQRPRSGSRLRRCSRSAIAACESLTPLR